MNNNSAKSQMQMSRWRRAGFVGGLGKAGGGEGGQGGEVRLAGAPGRDRVIAGGDSCQVTGRYFSEADNLQEFSHNKTG